MSIFEQFETDAKKEAEGAEVEFSPNQDGSVPTFIIAATSRTNQKYAKALEAAIKPFRGNLAAMGNEAAERIYRDVFVKTVLKGWRNIKDKDGTEIPYSSEEAIKLFNRVPRLYDALNEKAASIETFKEIAREDEAGN